MNDIGQLLWMDTDGNVIDLLNVLPRQTREAVAEYLRDREFSVSGIDFVDRFFGSGGENRENRGKTGGFSQKIH